MEYKLPVKWRIRDIIDLEYFLHRDGIPRSDGHPEDAHARDRSIFLHSIQPAIRADEPPDRQFMIKTWLDRRRETEQTTVLPGDSVVSLYNFFCFMFLAAGLVIGGGTGASFLSYTGDSPVNVFVYLAVFIFSQLLLLLLLLVLFPYRFSRKSLLSSSPLYALTSRLMLKMLLAARNEVEKKMPADRRGRIESALGAVAGKSRSYGFLFFLQTFILAQLFAIGFNTGLLAATLFKVVTADIAFGWQSTIRLSSAAVSAMVQKMALPWSWAVPVDMAFPSLAQIEGSRIILKEGIYHLSTPNLVSWWPFLCFSVAVYGLLPRFILLLAAVLARRTCLGSLEFRQGIHEQLLQRMTAPLVSSRGSGVDDAALRENGAAPLHWAAERSPADRVTGDRNLLVMIPDEIYDACRREDFGSAVNRNAGYVIREMIRINRDYESDRELLAVLEKRARRPEFDILIIQEAWQPPIMEYTDFIRQVRKAVGDGPCIRIGLIGKPRPDTIFTPVNEANREIWTRKINALGDPCIYTEGLVSNAS